MATGSRRRARVMMSFDSTVMSASLPTVSEPLMLLLERRVRAVQRVRLQRLQPRHLLIAVEHRAVLQLAASRWRSSSAIGSTSSTGASVPLATTAPVFISFCQT